MNDRIESSHLPESPGIYRIICVLTGESYVGSSENIRDRCRGHAGRLATGKHDQRKLLDCYCRHGIAAFRFEVVEMADVGQLAEVERAWLGKLQPSLNSTFRVCRKSPDGFGVINIRNPRVRQIVAEEMDHGAGRNAAEAAENLILAEAERRRLDRAQQKRRRQKQPA